MTILFAYDASESADAALRAAAGILDTRGADVVVLSVWEPLLVEAINAARFGPAAVPTNAEEIDERSERDAERAAEHGAQLAAELGFDAKPLAIADERNVADAIVDAADDRDVDLIVLGARGLAGIRAFLGSVSNHVLQHSRRPVLVIPPKGAATPREKSATATSQAQG
jgi:nucleotide-binding universal stress UspA family protein